ncbi:ribonucleoside-diphosphate reductase, adenosylcobalamin-dependent [Candidatus Jorgensenbacteria bacterium RIFCSPLOWO2_02_FULL_45_12]|uniref:Vitamin B12-dependent ribonucleotide reductase n=1 Tax=Candidatus Jorgensenbacteria bacterium RIFCSPHIGHO2_02_FULL_45_20 TaxID=1798470 RepID=A0A1F6BNI4_9BACT|nr:MAG: ribonucleoside-diphosphate reductase, adenosylcobalamin-dependent [Candidatus Jorgensenbacteria bacterium RIFCSPHIGHO2_02_FULL_45_20]OGG42413.1 MAG: ribonucleoside-diphosphate reductase, adenosylcobalamin-dependent [Candidatus Jorgensenbacteria bacterium RIFCSPLOWO2_02_FULL_45_12]
MSVQKTSGSQKRLALTSKESKEQKDSKESKDINLIKETNLIPLPRRFTKESQSPYDEVTWVKRDAAVGGGGETTRVFEQKNVDFPDFWSMNAVNITVSKYFHGRMGSDERETNLKIAISRVVKTIRDWGERFGYFKTKEQAQVFEDELTNIILFQKASFNSPVWFNVGTSEHPQCSACFILSVEDNMESILDWIKTEGLIFKNGSGAGINLSKLRSKIEGLSAGGRSSGPVAFMRGADSVAGMIKSGGITRRAAKMVILDVDHPDVHEFILTKSDEEKKIRAFLDAGFNMRDLNDEAWNSIQYQNANNSVRITDDFMQAVERDTEWLTRTRRSGEAGPSYNARWLLNEIAEAAWACGDPGVQFDTTINKWHTCPNSGRINASNPCSEYMHIDDSACNLASINLLKFIDKKGMFLVDDFTHTINVLILAQDIIVEGSSYPTEKITKNARAFRQLGLGFANLGALLMRKGLPYDSEEGRALAAEISSLMSGEAYRFSALIAKRMGTFAGFPVNKEPMMNVIKMHGIASQSVNTFLVDDDNLSQASRKVWNEAYALGKKYGYRNSQVTVIAPTGTISFMMDCDTTGIEPDFSLVKFKQLAGGGGMKIVNMSLESALVNLGYMQNEITEIIAWILENGTIEGAPHMKESDLAVFDCAVKPAKGTRSISWKGHVKMVAAVQPFISGAISKTFNMPNETTKEEIAESYIMAWKSGIKSFAVYRDGSKAAQPLSTSSQGAKKDAAKDELPEIRRKRLSQTHASETHKFSVAGHEGYITYGMYEDGSLGELFIIMSKQGSTLSGLLDSFAVSVSLALQYGVPLKRMAQKFIYTRFEPAGFTENPDIRIATSLVDYIFRYLVLRFLGSEDLSDFGMIHFLESKDGGINGEMDSVGNIESEIKIPATIMAKTLKGSSFGSSSEHVEKNGNGRSIFAGTVCKKCGGMMVRTGTCMTCQQCGDTSGGCS